MDINIFNIKKSISKIKDLESYDVSESENQYIIQGAAFDLMSNSEMKSAIILMGNEINRLKILTHNLEEALTIEMKNNEKSI